MAKKIVKISLLSLLLLPLLLMLFQAVCTWIDQHRFQPPGERVQVNGRYLHYLCTGKGPYTVVLDAGLGQGSFDWSLVQPKLARFSRVFSYDRAGLGWSDESPAPKTSEQIVEELHLLLHQAAIEPPYILVGHSFGGINMQLYYSKYPDEVRGIVLVDSCHPDQFEKLPPAPEELSILEKHPKLLIFLARLGIGRLFFQLPSTKKFIKEVLPFDSDVRKAWIAEVSSTKYVRTLIREDLMLKSNLRAIKNKNISFGAIPLAVIVAGRESTGTWTRSYEHFLEWEREIAPIWEDLQQEIASKSSQSEVIIATESDHMILRNQPEIIVQAVKALIRNKG